MDNEVFERHYGLWFDVWWFKGGRMCFVGYVDFDFIEDLDKKGLKLVTYSLWRAALLTGKPHCRCSGSINNRSRMHSCYRSFQIGYLVK